MSGIPQPMVNPDIQYTQCFINNEWVDSVSGRTFATINPATGKKIIDVQEGDKADIERAVAAAKTAWARGSVWRDMAPSKRGKLLHKVADLIEKNSVYLASLECLDNGKPYTHALFVDVNACVSTLRYMAGWADKIQGRTISADGPYHVYTRHEPVGICGQIIPWNYPMLMFIWKVAPALACGNVVVLKPAEQTPLTALFLASLFKQAGFPPGVLNVVPGFGPTAGAAISNHMDINKVAFTGSTEVGQLIMQAAAKTNLKRVTLELGGKSPLIIMPDADLDEAASVAHMAIFTNSGQICTSGSRLFVHEKIHDEFVEKIVYLAKNRPIGDPFDMSTQSGPQVDADQYQKILGLIESGKASGAKLQCGGSNIGDAGFFIQNTIFTDVNMDMRIAREEIFGPVQCVIKFSCVEEVIRVANNTQYGLAAGVFTNDINTYIQLSEALEAGTVWVNTYYANSLNAPFGGFKMSGVGREMGEYGLSHYTEVKTVVVKIGDSKL